MTDHADIPAPATGFDPTAEDAQRNPYPYYRWLLRNDPVHRGAQGIWYVSRHADVRALLTDRRFTRAGIRDFWAELIGPGPLTEIVRRTIIFQDEPDHGRLRAVVAPAFAPARLRSLERRIVEVVDSLLAPVAERGRLDVVNDLAYPLALTAVSEILGLPTEDHARVRTWSLRIGRTLDRAATMAEIARGEVAIAEFADYIERLIAQRRGGTTTDLIGLMLAATGDGRDAAQRISMNEIVSLVVTLIFAGHETVTNQIGNGLLALLRHPDQMALLRDRPDLVPGAVEECLRYDSSVQSNSRQVSEDVEFHGKTMHRGDFVILLAGAANRDPAQFRDPDRFDVTRADNHPLSFGAGMRYCLGAILARLQLKAAFNGLLRLPALRLAIPDEHLVYQRSTLFRGLVSLPVAVSPAVGVPAEPIHVGRMCPA